GRLCALLSESERGRCDATLALAIATISGLRLALLDAAGRRVARRRSRPLVARSASSLSVP
ncbi:hypothetical protein ACV344_34600, partial [Pseudomonas aeruginosa]